MPRIQRETRIDAPRERVFDLARHVEAHVATMPDEEAVEGTGLLGPGDRVTFRAPQFGIPFELAAEVVEFDRPRRFRDVQRSGVFGSLSHEHTFEEVEGGTLMRDDVRFSMPFEPFGRLGAPVARWRLRRLVDYHAKALKRLAEGGDWQQYLDS
ncbi:SRPBCC family protein [Haloarcula nitratireducens]|uniref:SRPBCC family protein n=1 Tax=Haloarcula nitratireducens TaxID=2487749 RepID=A0AAW4PAN8_9EURY|nr:SRPBCC family protein [Halomicroarcula nitratireducens]MBX0294342.1 SRPBCC family protein [Halomicroarcula nitratireducens]